MIGSLDCLPCLSLQATTTVRLATADVSRQQAGIGEALMHLAMMDPATPPPLAADDLQRTLSRHVANVDPYAEIRLSLTQAARALFPALLRMKQSSDDPWGFALLVSAAGNLLEAAREPSMAGVAMETAWQATARGSLTLNEGAELHASASKAGQILFIADHAGETVWDRLLIDELGAARVTLAVRHLPYLHAALQEDLDFTTWPVPPRVATYDDPPPGHPASGDASSLDRLLEESDLVIAKGSSWPDRLQGRVSPRTCFHILAPACARVAARFGVPARALVVAQASRLSVPTILNPNQP